MNMTASRDWQLGGTSEDGRFFASDLQPGEWELQLCPKGYRAIRGVVEIDESSPIESFDLLTDDVHAQL